MDEIGVSKFEEHFTAFIDLLGFREASTGADEATTLKVLAFLVALSALSVTYLVHPRVACDTTSGDVSG